MNDEKAKTQSGLGSLQREASQAESRQREKIKDELRKKIQVIRQGHHTGGYIETEKLHEEEKKLDAILRTELEEAKQQHGYSPDPKFKPEAVRKIELELNGLSWKPRLVVAENQ